MLSRNLTFKVSSNQVAVQLSAVTVSNVPIAVSGDCPDRPFAAMARVAKADPQMALLFHLTWRACMQRQRSPMADSCCLSFTQRNMPNAEQRIQPQEHISGTAKVPCFAAFLLTN